MNEIEILNGYCFKEWRISVVHGFSGLGTWLQECCRQIEAREVSNNRKNLTKQCTKTEADQCKLLSLVIEKCKVGNYIVKGPHYSIIQIALFSRQAPVN